MMQRGYICLILLFAFYCKQFSTQNATTISSTTVSGINSNESNSSSSESNSSSSEEDSQESSPSPFPLQFQQFTCLNDRLVQFLQLGISFNDNLLQCTSTLTNLGDATYDRLTDYNFQFDDLSSSYALFTYCPTSFCRLREAISLITDVAQIAADLNAIQYTLQTNSSVAGRNSTLGPNAGNVPVRLNATERSCINSVVNNVVNVFNNISSCIPGST